ncbi:MAG: alpha/beta hydrolase [Gammaproteobacteria bacterium]|nr:alpha/beta hydrolase [Gammaproteobacteria bacterium]
MIATQNKKNLTLWGRKILNLLANILGFIILLNIALYFFQPKLIFIPYKTMNETPKDWGLKYEEVFFQTSDNIKLHGWYIPHKDAKQTLLFFHGNAGNISHRGESIKIFHRLGLNVFITDYRGYGKSEGQPSEDGLYEDARSSWNYLLTQKDIQADSIVLFGRSLGGAVATKLATEVSAEALILESTFSSASKMAKSLYPGLSSLIYLRFNFDNVTMVKQVQTPLLLMHSPDDEIIPLQQGQKVFLAANHPKKMVILQGNHNNGFLQSQPNYEHQLKKFLTTLNPKKDKPE